MRVLVFNSKGGCGKSLLAREIVAAPKAKDIVIVEIDKLNSTQQPYKPFFKDVIELDDSTITNLLKILNSEDNVVIDVGADHLAKTIDTLVKYDLFADIDLVIIPMASGRTDAENALGTYLTVSKFTKSIMFAFSRCNEAESLKRQYEVFFANYSDATGQAELKESDYVVINDSSIFVTAQTSKQLAVNLADKVDHKAKALEAKKEGDMQLFEELMDKELNKRAAAILVKECIMPAHTKIMARIK